MDTPPLERKLVAILAADVEGYSRLMHDDEDATLATLSRHRAIIDGLIEGGRGHIRGTAGDSILAEFASVVDAVNCAVAIQQVLARENEDLPVTRRMNLRIGVNVGDVVVMEGDIYGDGVNVAARLEAFAEPGGICATRAVRDQVRDRVEFEFRDAGEHRVKNIARPVHIFRILFDLAATVELPGAAAPVERAAAEADPVELAFWSSVEASDRAAEYVAYLERYPEGAFASLARSRLALSAKSGSAASGAPAAPEDRAVELAFWDSVRGSEEPAMFRAYLDKFPDGEFRALAEIHLLGLEGRSAMPFARHRPPHGLFRAA